MSALQVARNEPDALQETLLGEALEHAPIAAIVLDETGRYLAANRSACRLTGYQRDELLALTPTDLPTQPDKVPAMLEEMASGDLASGSIRIRCRDGSCVSVEYRVGATRSGGLPYFVLVFWERASDDE